jgi:hypothetical protein
MFLFCSNALGMGDVRSIRERFPGPWRVEETHGGHFVVVAANGSRLAWVYVASQSWQHDGLAVSEARAVAVAISRLVDLRSPHRSA